VAQYCVALTLALVLGAWCLVLGTAECSVAAQQKGPSNFDEP
jgi:hypothetical protein